MRVWTWQAHHREATGSGQQARFLVAAPTKAAAARAVDEDPRRLFNLGETRKESDIAQAMFAPGVVYWQDMRGYNCPWNLYEVAR